MVTYKHSQLWSPSGELLWQGKYEDRQECLKGVIDSDSLGILKLLCDTSKPSFDKQSCTSGDVIELAETLQFVDRQGCIPGFLNILPSATLLEECMHSFNCSHLEQLNAIQIDFPTIFDNSVSDTADLTSTYEMQGRMFTLGNDDGHYRLAYAADPGLFNWLRGRKLKTSSLPYAIFSPQQAFRRWKSGEIRGLDHVRQFALTDLHILCRSNNAIDSYLKFVALGADGVRFWFKESWAKFIDVDQDFLIQFPKLGSTVASIANQFTLLNVFEKRPRYYAFRSGIMVDAGFYPVMLYNFQWDDTNGERFLIHTEDGQFPVIIHGTVAAGWQRILPIILGRGLSGLSSKIFPVELAPVQVVCLPLKECHLNIAEEYAKRLRSLGLRVNLDTVFKDSLGKRVNKLRKKWQPYYVVLGDKELENQEPKLQNFIHSEVWTLDEFWLVYGERISRCNSYKARFLELPFV